jgi:hypothetical protein
MRLLSPTYAQLGDAATPDAHASGAVVDDPRDEIPEGAPAPQDFPAVGRFAFRMSGRSGAFPNQTATADGAAGTSTVSEHESRGQADARRQWTSLSPAGYPELPERTTVSPEQIRTEPHGAVSIPGVTPLTVARAGSTSADPSHTAGMPRFLYDRPFDAWAAQHPLEVSKLPMPSPLASSPISQRIGTPGGEPSPGGVDGITVWDPVSVWRNTVRQVPQPYDETAVVGTTVQPVQSRKWRLT